MQKILASTSFAMFKRAFEVTTFCKCTEQNVLTHLRLIVLKLLLIHSPSSLLKTRTIHSYQVPNNILATECSLTVPIYLPDSIMHFCNCYLLPQVEETSVLPDLCLQLLSYYRPASAKLFHVFLYSTL